MPRYKGMHKEDIKAAVRKRGINFTELAVNAGLSTGTCRMSLCKPIPAANRVIADLLGLSLHTLWPQWYDTEGQRIRSRSKSKSSRKRSARHCKKAHGGFA